MRVDLQESGVATKTISIDLDAYERLAAARRGNESFSQVIKRVVRPSVDFEAITELLRANALSPSATRAVERQVSRRRRPSRRER